MKNESTRAAAPRKDQSGTRGGNAPAKKKYYRRPHRPTLGVRVFIALMCALLAFLLAVVVAYYCGYRYICIEREDGELVRFVGRVDATGTPYAGRLYYSSGIKAKINTAAGRIEYSNGATYSGDLVDFYRDGVGTLTLKNGDEYTGEFKGDVITGRGVYKFSGGDVYEGEFIAGVKEGTGRYT